MSDGLISTMTSGLPLAPEYGRMLDLIRDAEPAVALATAQHGKSHSQFQYAMLDCSGPVAGPTKLRNWRQVLAVIERTQDALNEAALKVREHQAIVAVLKKNQRTEEAEEAALTQVKIDEALLHSQMAQRAMAGAVRQLALYTLQFQELERQIRVDLGKAVGEPITEEDFERDEERFHIQKAFQQALQAARVLGHIDHGNMIYLDDLGISGAAATADVAAFLQQEARAMNEKPNDVLRLHALEREWLNGMADRYAGCARSVAKAKGLIPGVLTDAVLSLSKEGDEP